MKKTFCFVTAVFAVVVLASGCGSKPGTPADSAATSGAAKPGDAFSECPSDDEQSLLRGVERRASGSDRGPRRPAVTLDAQFNSLKQKNDCSDLVLQSAAGIFLNPVNWEGITGTLVQAKQKNIPVVVVDAPVKDADLVLCQVASDNVEAGRLAAQALNTVRPDAKVVILHQSVNKACIDRVEGFKEELAKYPGMTILDTQEGKGTAEGARPVMRDLLSRFPEVNAVFPINDPSAGGLCH